MTSKQRVKGFGFEREVVKQFRAIGWVSDRSWGSNGQSSGLPQEVDVTARHPTIPTTSDTEPTPSPLWFQCKRIKQLPQWLGLTDNVDAVILREDNGQALVLFRLDDFIKRFL